MPETVEDDGEGSDGSPSDDLESAVLPDNKGAIKFGWIRGVLVSLAPREASEHDSSEALSWFKSTSLTQTHNKQWSNLNSYTSF